jgi:hypothetical protein
MRPSGPYGEIVDPMVGRVLAAYARVDRARVDTEQLRTAMRPGDLRYVTDLETAWSELPSRANVVNPMWLGERDRLAEQADTLAAFYEAINARVRAYAGGGSTPAPAPAPALAPAVPEADSGTSWGDWEMPGIDVGGLGAAIPWLVLGAGALILLGADADRRQRR